MALKLNGSSSGYVAIDAPASAGSNTLVLPADNGSNGEYLQTNGSGTLDWAAVSVGGASGTDYNDTVKVRFGDGNDLEIFHNSENSYIKDVGTGALVISSNTLYLNNAADNETLAKFTEDGACEFYYNNVKMANTCSVGLEVTKNLYLKTTVAAPPSATQEGAAFLSTGTDSILRSSCGTWTQSANHFECFNGNGQVGSISTNGSATSYNTSSDYRLKQNEVAISDGITRLKTLKPYRFKWKADTSKTVDGFFAHEVTAVPEAVKGTKDAVADKDNATLGIKKDDPIYQQIDQSKLVPLLTAALQEAITKIETLETKVAALEAA